ncbi:MAG: hypothetical protein ACI4FZ_06280 [Lachnospiraceae bacterium]
MFVIFFSVIIALVFLLLSVVLKGMAALVEATIEMVDVLAALLFGGGIILILDLLVDMFCGRFWDVVLLIVVFCVVIYVGSMIFGVIEGLLELVGALILLICSWTYTLIDILGGKCESGLMYFLGVINRKISVS